MKWIFYYKFFFFYDGNLVIKQSRTKPSYTGGSARPQHAGIVYDSRIRGKWTRRHNYYLISREIHIFIDIIFRCFSEVKFHLDLKRILWNTVRLAHASMSWSWVNWFKLYYILNNMCFIVNLNVRMTRGINVSVPALAWYRVIRHTPS